MARPKLSLLFVAPAVLGLLALGCTSGNGPDPTGAAGEADCTAAGAHITACGLNAEAFAGYYSSDDVQICSTDEGSVCMAECIAKASCAELTAFTMQTENDEGCPVGGDPTSECMSGCYGTMGCYTPLVLSFEGAAVTFAHDAHAFDFRLGMSVATDWPTAATPWLALDRNGNGAIDDASELFGSASPLAAGGVASNGFQALADFDSNGDGRITPDDEVWSRLLVWSDRNGDRVSTRDELSPLDRFGIVSIDLGYARVPRCDDRGNCEVERASFHYRASATDERQGVVVDVHLRLNP
jgi:hypothetical protein